MHYLPKKPVLEAVEEKKWRDRAKKAKTHRNFRLRMGFREVTSNPLVGALHQEFRVSSVTRVDQATGTIHVLPSTAKLEHRACLKHDISNAEVNYDLNVK